MSWFNRLVNPLTALAVMMVFFIIFIVALITVNNRNAMQFNADLTLVTCQVSQLGALWQGSQYCHVLQLFYQADGTTLDNLVYWSCSNDANSPPDTIYQPNQNISCYLTSNDQLVLQPRDINWLGMLFVLLPLTALIYVIYLWCHLDNEGLLSGESWLTWPCCWLSRSNSPQRTVGKTALVDESTEILPFDSIENGTVETNYNHCDPDLEANRALA